MADNDYWKKKYADYHSRSESRIAELKAENEKLKVLCDMYKTFYRAKHDDIKGILFKYRQTLQEIKEIAEFHITQADSEDVQNDMKQIIDLITKAEEE